MSRPNDLCQQCKSTGLAMHVAIALPTPQGCGAPTLPGWANLPQITSVKLKGYDYSLRVPRAGFLYCFFKKNSRGANRWQAWEVGEGGAIYPMPTADWAIPLADLKCTRDGHSELRLHFVVIEDPHLCQTAWLAFSEHAWSGETLQRYASDERLRGERMLRFEPAQLIASDSASSSGIVPASAAVLESISDYTPAFGADKLPHGIEAKVRPVSRSEKGDFSADVLSTHSTRYPWAAGRKAMAERAAQTLRLRSRKIDDTPHPGVVVALPDGVGCAHEMNGYRNDVAGRIEQYGRERGLQISALNAFDGLKLVLKERAIDAIDRPWRWSAEQTATRLEGARSAGAGSERMSLEQDLCRRWEEDAAARVPSMLAQQRDMHIARDAHAYADDQRRIDASIAKSRRSNGTPMQKERREADAEQSARAQWEKCEQRFDLDAIKTFRANWAAFCDQATTLIDTRTEELVQWLQAPALLTALEDYAQSDPVDGIAFEDVIGSAIVGMASSPAGAAKIDAWVKEMQASKGNLLWRAVAANQRDASVEVNAALQRAYATPVPLSEHAWASIAKDLKWNKIADIGKKSLSLHNTNMKARNDAGSGIAVAEKARGLDRILATAGHRMLKPLARAGDTVNELALQTFLAVRAGAEPQVALALAEAQIKHQAIERDDLVRRLRNNDHYLNEAARARQAELGARWKALRTAADTADAKTGAFNAARDARIALVVALFEGLNLYKTSEKFGAEPNDVKLKMQLRGAQLATGAAVIDVVSNVVKGVADAKDKAVTFQTLKVGGGALSVAGSVYGMLLDFGSIATAWDGRDWRKVVLYGERFGFQLLGAGLSSLVSLSYCSPALQAFGERQLGTVVGQAAKWAGRRLLIARAALMLAGLEVAVFVQGVSLVIYCFEPGDLEKWCDLSAFGKERSERPKDAYRSADQQELALSRALVDLL